MTGARVRNPLRVLLLAAVSISLVVATLVAVRMDAQAKPGDFKTLDLIGVCNSVSVKLAELIDAEVKKADPKDGVVLSDQPKKGEKGYVEEVVATALIALAKLLGKNPAALTDDDIKNNAADVKKAVDAAVADRK